jgi:hypothetical protein
LPLCERYRLVYGHQLYTGVNPTGRALPSTRRTTRWQAG